MEAWNELMQNAMEGDAGAQRIADEIHRLGLSSDIDRAEALQKMERWADTQLSAAPQVSAPWLDDKETPWLDDKEADPFGGDEGAMEAEIFGLESKAPPTAPAPPCQGMLNG